MREGAMNNENTKNKSGTGLWVHCIFIGTGYLNGKIDQKKGRTLPFRGPSPIAPLYQGGSHLFSMYASLIRINGDIDNGFIGGGHFQVHGMIPHESVLLELCS